ncbi:hypothetical protein FHS90_004299 [Rufibacter quisquiliarum]|uniref:Uncharacterized protein n=1 Tax=Rufibacter quisquiliarum TaxID=1549639 RepID=A0A839H0X7_9BACT|nr:hypothetical protein [Rufibacter quisquiliarum]
MPSTFISTTTGTIIITTPGGGLLYISSIHFCHSGYLSLL